MIIIEGDDILDELMSDDEGEEDDPNLYDDYTEPSFGPDEEYSAGLLSTIWEENTQSSAVSSHKTSSVAPLHCSRSSLVGHDSANTDLYDDSNNNFAGDLWMNKSNSDSFATGEGVPLYESDEDDFSLETFDSGKIKESDRNMGKRWSSEISYNSSVSISSKSAGGGLIPASTAEDVGQSPKITTRRRSLVRSLSDSSLNSSSSSNNMISNTEVPNPEPTLKEALDLRLQRRSVLETSRDAIIAQLVDTYLGKTVDDSEGEDDVDGSCSTHKQRNTYLSLDSYLAASIASEALGGGQQKNSSSRQPPGKPVRRYSWDSAGDIGDSSGSVLSGDSLVDRLQRLPNANAFNADELDGKNDTPLTMTRKPVRQRSWINLTLDDASNTDNVEQDSWDGNSSSSTGTSFRNSGVVKRRGSFMSNSSADLTIEEGENENDYSSSDDETLDSDVEDDMPLLLSRQYLASLKGGMDDGSEDAVDSDLRGGKSTISPKRQYLTPWKGSDHDEEDDLADVYQDPQRDYLVPLRGEAPSVPSSDDSAKGPLKNYQKEDDGGDSAMPTTQSLPADFFVPKNTVVSLALEDERVDASFVLENHLLKEQGCQSPGTLLRRRGSGGKRKIKYDMARSAISPKIDKQLAPVGKIAPVTDQNLEHCKTPSYPTLSIPQMDDAEGPPLPGPPPPSPPQSLMLSQEVDDSVSDPELSPLKKNKPTVHRNKDNKRIRVVRSHKTMSHAEARLSNIPNILGEGLDDIEQDFPQDHSSTQMTEATTSSSTSRTDGSSQLEILDATNQLLSHSNHSTRSKSTRMNMAGILDISDHTASGLLSPTQSSSQKSLLQHATTDSDGDDRSVSSTSSSHNARTVLKKGLLQRGKQRLQKIFRPSSAEADESSE